tara:strand:+ start:65364 stop:66992 length:1629 start_codon:yes stop_codon:yes gene_type:complete
MNDTIDAPVVDETTEESVIAQCENFFAPVSFDLIDQLVGQYQQQRQNIEDFGQYLNSRVDTAVLEYFAAGNDVEQRYRITSLHSLLRVEGALKALDAAYWDKALKLTDVLDCMPQARRSEWFEQIRQAKTPPFEAESVRATLMDLLNSRARFLAERVDGLFRSLSNTHVTNRPEGFSKRMILNYVIDNIGFPSTTKAGHINDLRAVIARLLGREEPKWTATYPILKYLYQDPGVWYSLDGGALRLRVYKKGTAHLEVHPDLAWRLNQILAYLYPSAIPAKFRSSTPERVNKKCTAPLMQRPLPNAVLAILKHARVRADLMPGHFAVYLLDHNTKNPAAQEAASVLNGLGGVAHKGNQQMQVFDYDPTALLEEIFISGCVPDRKSHQFYPTPSSLVEQVQQAAQITYEHRVLEPSAGQGALVAGLTSDQVTCVEISALHAQILREKGFSDVHQMDFMAYSQHCSTRFDRIVMNPPFSQGRWREHLTAASTLVGSKGRLVAILPSGARNRVQLDGFDCQYSRVIDNAFAGTSVSVVILTADRTH